MKKNKTTENLSERNIVLTRDLKEKLRNLEGWGVVSVLEQKNGSLDYESHIDFAEQDLVTLEDIASVFSKEEVDASAETKILEYNKTKIRATAETQVMEFDEKFNKTRVDITPKTKVFELVENKDLNETKLKPWFAPELLQIFFKEIDGEKIEKILQKIYTPEFLDKQINETSIKNHLLTHLTKPEFFYHLSNENEISDILNLPEQLGKAFLKKMRKEMCQNVKTPLEKKIKEWYEQNVLQNLIENVKDQKGKKNSLFYLKWFGLFKTNF